eukprot:PITA_11289
MKESDTIDSFFTQVIGLITQIRSHGEILEERRIVEKILRSLPSKFEAVVVAIEETKDLSQFMNSRLRCLSAKEKAEAEQITEVVEEAKVEADIILQAQAEGAAIRTKICKQQAHGQRYDKSQVQCHYCKKYGHYANECSKKQNDMNSRQNVNFANEENKNPKNVLLTCSIAQDKQEDIWFLDSGCSNHMTGNIAMFANLDEDVKSEVTTGTDSKISVKGKGKVNI